MTKVPNFGEETTTKRNKTGKKQKTKQKTVAEVKLRRQEPAPGTGFDDRWRKPVQSRFFPDGPEPTGRLLCACAEFSQAQPRKPCLLVHIGPADLEEAGSGGERPGGTAVLGLERLSVSFPRGRARPPRP